MKKGKAKKKKVKIKKKGIKDYIRVSVYSFYKLFIVLWLNPCQIAHAALMHAGIGTERTTGTIIIQPP